MSLFKVKPWWSNEKLQSNEIKEGLQNHSCLKIDKFNSHTDSDCVILGEGMLLKLYKPNKDVEETHTLLEAQFSDAILQIETGKFITGNDDRQILVLHPFCFSIYQLLKTQGHTDAGDQNSLKQLTKRSFKRKAYSVTCGPFGNIRTRDFICIQALDGSLSFFDQETFMFMYNSNDNIIPGPVCYIANTDAFVICKSTWVLEIQSYQQLRELSEPNVRQNKHAAQWVYNAGEEISAVQVIQTSSNISSIVALGERHLCCFQDNGLMKYMIKFDFIPICFHAYLIGWYYEPTARLLIMVSSDDSKLNIYEGTTLLWSCDLLHTAISISRCFIKHLPGGLVSLSTKGIVSVFYIGTEPDLNSNAGPMLNEVVNPELIINELEDVEEDLRKILDGEEDVDSYSRLVQILNIKTDVGKPVQNLQQFTNDNFEPLHSLMSPVVVILTCEDPKFIQSVQVTFSCRLPLSCSNPTVCLENINGTEIIETHAFLSGDGVIADTKLKIYFTIIDSTGKINIMNQEVSLPLSLYCVPCETVIDNTVKLVINTNGSCVDLLEIFTDFIKDDLTSYGGGKEVITFMNRTTKRTVTIKNKEKAYSIEAQDYADIVVIIDSFTENISQYLKKNNESDKVNIILEDDFIRDITHKFMKSIENHAKERTKLETFVDELNVLQKQFTLVQKRLLVQYGSLPPGDCDPLEFLMRDTHNRIVNAARDILETREIVSKAGCNLSAIGRLLIFIFKQSIPDNFKVKLIEETLTLGSLYEDYQQWEEAVSQAMSYIIKNVFQKSEKDKEKLSTVTEHGILSHINLKRFLKQIRMILDKMFSEIRTDSKQEKIERIEEFVEVI